MNLDDEILKDAQERAARARAAERLRMRVLGTLFAVVALGGLGWTYRLPITLALEGSPAAYDQAKHRKGWLRLLRRTLPRYVVAAGSDDAARRDKAGAAFMEACAFHQGMRPRCAAVVEAVADAQAWMTDSRTQRPETARQHLDAVMESVALLEERMRRAGVPFVIDDDIGAWEEDHRWHLRFLVTTGEVVETYRFEAEGGPYVAEHVRRLDSLNVVDLVHGKAGRGVARVMEEGARVLVNDRYLPALGKDGVLRGFGAEVTAADLSLEATVNALRKMLPDDVAARADRVGELARERRAILEEVAGILKEQQVTLIEPQEFMVSRGWLKRMTRRLGARHADLVARLKRFSVLTDLPAEDVALVERAHAAILQHHVLGVARHEAWHLAQPDPPPVDGVPDAATRELVAYVGALADAGGEAWLVWDHAMGLSVNPETARTPTGVAVRKLVGEILRARMADKDAHAVPDVTAEAGALKARWFKETRVMRWMPARGAAAPATDAPEAADEDAENEEGE